MKKTVSILVVVMMLLGLVPGASAVSYTPLYTADCEDFADYNWLPGGRGTTQVVPWAARGEGKGLEVIKNDYDNFTVERFSNQDMRSFSVDFQLNEMPAGAKLMFELVDTQDSYGGTVHFGVIENNGQYNLFYTLSNVNSGNSSQNGREPENIQIDTNVKFQLGQWYTLTADHFHEMQQDPWYPCYSISVDGVRVVEDAPYRTPWYGNSNTNQCTLETSNNIKAYIDNIIILSNTEIVGNTAPTLVSTSPSDGATEVATESATVSVVFDMPVNGLTIDNFTIDQGASIVSVTPSADNDSATLQLSGLQLSTRYTITIGSGITAAEGGLSFAGANISFTTADVAYMYFEGFEGDAGIWNGGNGLGELVVGPSTGGRKDKAMILESYGGYISSVFSQTGLNSNEVDRFSYDLYLDNATSGVAIGLNDPGDASGTVFFGIAPNPDNGNKLNLFWGNGVYDTDNNWGRRPVFDTREEYKPGQWYTLTASNFQTVDNYNMTAYSISVDGVRKKTGVPTRNIYNNSLTGHISVELMGSGDQKVYVDNLKLIHKSDNPVPEVSETIPADGATDVTTTLDTIIIQFSTPVNGVTKERFAITDASIDAATLSADKRSVELSVSRLVKNKTYTVSVLEGITSESDGKALAPMSFSFTTEGYVLFEDNFNAGVTDWVDTGDGWTLQSENGAMRINAQNGWIKRALPAPIANDLGYVFSFQFQIDTQAAGQFRMELYNEPSYQGSVSFGVMDNAGTLQPYYTVKEGDQERVVHYLNGTVTTGVYHTFRAECDAKAKTYALYLDEILLQSNIPYRAGSEEIGYISISTVEDGTPCNILIDNMAIYEKLSPLEVITVQDVKFSMQQLYAGALAVEAQVSNSYLHDLPVVLIVAAYGDNGYLRAAYVSEKTSVSAQMQETFSVNLDVTDEDVQVKAFVWNNLQDIKNYTNSSTLNASGVVQ